MEKENIDDGPPQSSLVGMNTGYDQPADPPSYSQETVGGDQPGQTTYPHGAYATQYGEPGMTNQYAYQYPGTAPIVVTQQPANQTHIILESAPPSDYSKPAIVSLVLSILGCLFCCWPLGIIAIVFSSLSISAATSGRNADARQYEKVARGLNIAGLVTGLVVYGTLIAIIAQQ